MSLRAIARRTGASVTTVYRWIRRWQREGHVFTRARGCKPRAWKSQNPIIRDTNNANGRPDLSTCPHAVNQAHLTTPNSYVLLKAQGKIDIPPAAIPAAPLARRHASHSPGIMCRDAVHGDGWRFLGTPSTSHPLTPAPRSLYSHLPGNSSELVAIRNSHRLSMAAFIDYLQLHESIHQLQIINSYEKKGQYIEGESMYPTNAA